MEIGIENQTDRTIQSSSLAAVARIEFVRTILRVETGGFTATIEIHGWQGHRWRDGNRSVGRIGFFAGTFENAILAFAAIGLLIVEQTGRTIQLMNRTADANEEATAAEWFHRTDRVWVVAVGTVAAVEDGSSRGQSLVRRRFGRWSRCTRFAAASGNVNPRFAHFNFAIEK